MNAGAVFPAAGAAEAPPPFVLQRPTATSAVPLVFASPHSGRLYPAEMMAASSLDPFTIRRSEDAFVDRLLEAAAGQGAATLSAVYARAFIDVNREAYELDPGMFEDALPGFARSDTARVAAGLGSIARIVSEGREIYARKLSVAEAMIRIDRVHAPYHQALGRLVQDLRARFGAVLLVDWHSMPAAAARTLGGDGCDLVLGDRFGAACAPWIIDAVEAAFAGLGYRVARNAPYAGGYTTEFYGRPAEGAHALQIEINRSLYLNEANLVLHAGFDTLKADLGLVFRDLAGLAQRLAASVSDGADGPA